MLQNHMFSSSLYHKASFCLKNTMHKVEFLFSSGKTLPQKIVCWENLNSKGAVNKVYNIARICVGGNCNSTKMHSDSASLSDVYAVLSGMFFVCLCIGVFVYLFICVFVYLCICVFVYANAPEYLLLVVVLPEPFRGNICVSFLPLWWSRAAQKLMWSATRYFLFFLFF